jgi:protein involved in temperature-dependent protein secretion
MDAKKFLDNGNIDQAARLSKAAVFADPVATNTRLLYIQLYGKVPDIRMRGF